MDTVYNKITVNGKTLIDISSDTVDAEHLMQGYTAHDSSGVQITGTATEGSGTALIVDTTDSHGGIIREITTDTEVRLQGRKTVTPTSQTQIITADTGYDGIVEVEVERVTGLANVYQDENGVLVLDSEGTDWQRPSEWMPYANGWNDDDFDGCYFVYDLIDNKSSLSFPQYYSIYARTNTGQFTVEEGYVDESGVFSVEETYNKNSGTRVGAFLPIWDGATPNERYYVVKITPSTGTLTHVGFTYLEDSIWQTKYEGASINQGGQGGFTALTQPCIEIYGRLPNYTSANYENRFRNYFLRHVNLIDMTSLTDMRSFFNGNISLEKIDGMETWDTSSVTNMSSLFSDCCDPYLSGIENWDVSNVTDFSYMFYGGKLNIYNLKKWDASSATKIHFMFQKTMARKIILPKNLDGTEYQDDMFRECFYLEDIDFNGSKINLNSYTFGGCYLLDLDLTSSSITRNDSSDAVFRSLYSTFLDNKKIKVIDMRGKDTSEITTLRFFAHGCYSLESVNFTGCDLSAVTDTNTNQFTNCPLLVELKGFVHYQSFNISHSGLMPAENLVEVLTNLPTVGSAKTITLGSTNKKKLTAEQIAIATEKGWTVA